MKLKIIIAAAVILLPLLIALSQMKNEPFTPAKDFPREALVYVQTSDLPAFIKLWNNSGFKEKYLESENFKEFQNRHLGRKLTSRWEEFDTAAGFSIDLEMLSGLAENRAAIALYDIGKLDFVFIAPMSNEVFAATRFVQNQDKFEEQIIDDETTIYRTNVEADRGRQKQELIYTYSKGRLIISTSEKLLAQTLKNIKEKTGTNSLADEPSFKALSEKISPQIATAWVNQEKLNDDYYFKHYWLMSDVANLKNIRAGIFDFAKEEGKLIESRKFLLNQPVNTPPIKAEDATKTLAHLPENIPFYRLQAANDKALKTAVQETIFEKQEFAENTQRNQFYYSSYDSFDSGSGDYSSLGENYDQSIDETDDEETITTSRESKTDFAELLRSARPSAVLTFTEPKMLPAPLFVEFHRVAIFNLAAPAAFKHDLFETAIEKSFLSRMAISSPGATVNWESKTENATDWREIVFPMTGQTAAYTIVGNELILANNIEFLKEIITTQASQDNRKQERSLTELTVLNFDQRETNYDQIFNTLADKSTASKLNVSNLDQSGDNYNQIFASSADESTTSKFFTGNIKSLLDSASEIKNIEVKRSGSGNFFDEEVTLNLQTKAQ